MINKNTPEIGAYKLGLALVIGCFDPIVLDSPTDKAVCDIIMNRKHFLQNSPICDSIVEILKLDKKKLIKTYDKWVLEGGDIRELWQYQQYRP